MADVPLGGIDIFHLVNDHHMQAMGLPGNHCAFVCELAGQVELDEVRRRVEAAVHAMPELGARLVRTLRGPVWRSSSRPRVPYVSLTELHGPTVPTIEGLLGRQTWALDVLRRSSGDTVLLRWFHPLTDGKGAERLLAWLGAGEGAELPAPPPPERRRGTSDRLLAKLELKARGELARAYGRHVTALAARPILSLASTVPRPWGATRVVRHQFSAEDTAAFDERVRKIARLGESAVMVHGVVRVTDRALVARGFAPVHHIVPVPLSLDPKTAADRMLGNNLTMMLFTVERADLDDPTRAVTRLLEQQRDVVRNKLDVAMIAALDFARYFPAGLTHWLTTRPFGGEISSVVFSNPGAVRLERLFGRMVLDAYPLPTVVGPPGFQVIFSRFRSRLSATVVYLDRVVGLAEARRMTTDLVRELCEGA
jgi:diacylglycerol O-acyltransferase